MNSEQLIAVTVFALASSFTPGPNNAIATSTGANFGLRAALPHVLGVPFGMLTLLLFGITGVAAVLLAHPAAMQVLRWVGTAYLFWIAWLIGTTRSMKERQLTRPFTFLQSALFQYANPKAWMMAVAAVGTYMQPQQGSSGIWPVCVIMPACGLAACWTWSWLGAALRHWLAHGERFAWFNRIMGGLLAATAVWMVLE